MSQQQHLMLRAPGERYGPLPEGALVSGQPVGEQGFGLYKGLGSPMELLGEAVGLAAFKEGTILNEGLTKSDGMLPALGKDYRPWFFRGIRKRIRYLGLKRKGVLDSTASIIHTTSDQEIIDTTRLETPLMELVPMETARGAVASYDILSTRGKSSFYTEAASKTASNFAGISDTYANATKALSIQATSGGWSDFGLAVAATQYPTRDYRALEIRAKTWSMNEGWENELLNGSTALESAYNSGSTGFIGIRGEIISSSGSYSGLTNSNLAGADVTDADIDSMIAEGTSLNVKYNLFVTDLFTWQKIKQLMIQVLRYNNPETEIAWGLKALAWATPYGVAPIVASKFMPTTSGSREIIFLDTKFLAQRVLLDSTMEMLAKTALQQTFAIKKFGVLIDKTNSAVQTYNNNANPTGTSGTSKMGRIYNIA